MIATPYEPRHVHNPEGINYDPSQGTFEYLSPLDFTPFNALAPINAHSFQLPGLGSEGPLCGHQHLSHFSSDLKSARYDLLSCRRIVCPRCWQDWARRSTFEIVLRIEALARSTGQRPYRCVFSVSPESVSHDSWDWDRVNTSLFHRGYRRSGNHGVDGGVAIFHPFRLKPKVKRQLRKTGIHNGVGMWAVVRGWVKDGADLFEFASFGPHVHSIVFGSPMAHSCDDFVLAFDDKNGVPQQLATTKDVVAFTRYLLSHVGVLMDFTISEDDPHEKEHRRKTHAIRSFGCLHHIDPEKLLPPAEYEALAKEIAGLLDMEWVDGELRYPASSRDIGTSDEGIEWLPIYKLGQHLADDAIYKSLSPSQRDFWDNVVTFMGLEGHSPNTSELKPPPDVSVFETKPPPGDST